MATANETFGPAPDAAEQLRRWDEGRSIWTIDMGGMGPGYEQAIQVLAIEIVRDEIGKPLPKKGTSAGDWAEATVSRVNASCGGFSGAQVSAAKSLAWHWLADGPAKTLTQVGRERHIQASKTWPRAEGAA